MACFLPSAGGIRHPARRQAGAHRFFPSAGGIRHPALRQAGAHRFPPSAAGNSGRHAVSFGGWLASSPPLGEFAIQPGAKRAPIAFPHPPWGIQAGTRPRSGDGLLPPLRWGNSPSSPAPSGRPSLSPIRRGEFRPARGLVRGMACFLPSAGGIRHPARRQAGAHRLSPSAAGNSGRHAALFGGWLASSPPLGEFAIQPGAKRAPIAFHHPPRGIQAGTRPCLGDGLLPPLRRGNSPSSPAPSGRPSPFPIRRGEFRPARGLVRGMACFLPSAGGIRHPARRQAGAHRLSPSAAGNSGRHAVSFGGWLASSPPPGEFAIQPGAKRAPIAFSPPPGEFAIQPGAKRAPIAFSPPLREFRPVRGLVWGMVRFLPFAKGVQSAFRALGGMSQPAVKGCGEGKLPRWEPG